MNTKELGELTQACVIASLLRNRVPVSIPYGDNQRYDLIIEVGGRLLKAQVKTARMIGDSSFDFPVSSSSLHRGGSRRTYRGEVNCFLVYNHHLRRTYMIPIKVTATASMTLRVNPAKNGQSSGVRFAKDFQLKRMLRKLNHLG